MGRIFNDNYGVVMLTEISVHLPNRPRELAEALQALKKANVNVLAFTIDQAGAYSIVRLICHPLKKAIEQLHEHVYSISDARVLAIPLLHEPGELYQLVDLLGANEINIEYGYLTLQSDAKRAIVLLKITGNKENEDKAKNLLIEKGYEDLDAIP